MYRNCSRCGTRVELTTPCATCLEWFNHRPAAATMTPQERAVEFDTWTVVEIPFAMILARVSELVGRQVYAYEMGESHAPALRQEILSQAPQSIGDVIRDLPPGSEIRRFDATGGQERFEVRDDPNRSIVEFPDENINN